MDIQMQFFNINMSFHQEQIKTKLLNAEIENYRKLYLEQKKLNKKHQKQDKKQSHLDLCEWSTNEKTTTFTSFPSLKFGSQNFRKIKNIERSPDQTFLTPYLTKVNFKQKDKTSLPNQINLSFNPEQTKKLRKKDKRFNNSLQKQLLKSLQKTKKDSLHNYLINGKIKISSTETKQGSNSINRSEHLLRLLRQREILRMKRYSFDIEGCFRTKSCLNS